MSLLTGVVEFYRQIREPLRAIPPFQREPDDEVDGSLTVAELGHALASHQRGKRLIQFPRCDAVGRRAIPIRFHPQLRNGGLLVELAVLETRNPFCDALNLGPNLPQLLEIRSEDLDRDGCRNAAEHMSDSVRQRAGQGAESSR